MLTPRHLVPILLATLLSACSGSPTENAPCKGEKCDGGTGTTDGAIATDGDVSGDASVADGGTDVDAATETDGGAGHPPDDGPHSYSAIFRAPHEGAELFWTPRLGLPSLQISKVNETGGFLNRVDASPDGRMLLYSVVLDESLRLPILHVVVRSGETWSAPLKLVSAALAGQRVSFVDWVFTKTGVRIFFATEPGTLVDPAEGTGVFFVDVAYDGTASQPVRLSLETMIVRRLRVQSAERIFFRAADNGQPPSLFMVELQGVIPGRPVLISPPAMMDGGVDQWFELSRDRKILAFRFGDPSSRISLSDPVARFLYVIDVSGAPGQPLRITDFPVPCFSDDPVMSDDGHTIAYETCAPSFAQRVVRWEAGAPGNDHALVPWPNFPDPTARFTLLVSPSGKTVFTGLYAMPEFAGEALWMSDFRGLAPTALTRVTSKRTSYISDSRTNYRYGPVGPELFPDRVRERVYLLRDADASNATLSMLDTTTGTAQLVDVGTAPGSYEARMTCDANYKRCLLSHVTARDGQPAGMGVWSLDASAARPAPSLLWTSERAIATSSLRLLDRDRVASMAGIDAEGACDGRLLELDAADATPIPIDPERPACDVVHLERVALTEPTL